MIPKKHATFLFVCLTFVLLVACEPLAPDQTPQIIVVTGETPDQPVGPSPSPLIGSGDVAGVLSTATAVSGLVNTPVPSVTPVPPPTAIPSPTPYACAERSGQVIRSSFTSAITRDEVMFRIYLPPCFYDTLQRYPYVILLHGTGYDDAMWDDLGAAAVMDQGITKGTLPPMVLVMPDGNPISEDNDRVTGQSYEDIIVSELIPLIESDFCLWGSRQGRAIGGISRGGFWAFSIALRHPELFSALGGHSPHFDTDNAPPAINPLDLAAHTTLDKFPMRIYMDNGADDYVGTNAIRMSDILRESGIEHEYVINPTGDHTEDYWSSHLAEYLAFYGRVWPYDVLALPSCLDPSPE